MLYMMCNSYTWVTAAPNRRIMIDRLISKRCLHLLVPIASFSSMPSFLRIRLTFPRTIPSYNWQTWKTYQSSVSIKPPAMCSTFVLQLCSRSVTLWGTTSMMLVLIELDYVFASCLSTWLVHAFGVITLFDQSDDPVFSLPRVTLLFTTSHKCIPPLFLPPRRQWLTFESKDHHG